jgi:tol-pal system protein YbgF
MKRYLASLVIAVPASLLSTSVMSAAGIVEAQPYLPGQAPSGVQPGSSSNDALVMLLDQFREMRAELETLRGLVEEQTYELNNLKRESLDRYTDLDSRLTSAGNLAAQSAPIAIEPAAVIPPMAASSQQASAAPVNAAAPVVAPVPASAAAQSAIEVAIPVQATAALATATAVATSQNPAVEAPAVQPTVLTEQQQYQLALDSLLQEEQYQRAVAEFDQYLTQYPNGRFVTNAYYWKGQAYVNLAMMEEARAAFETIVTQYPDGRKVDDAMYSLGTVYDKLGNGERAQQLLRQVQSRFPNTSAANLADIYLRSMN